jgi:hypothetical protein
LFGKQRMTSGSLLQEDGHFEIICKHISS